MRSARPLRLISLALAASCTNAYVEPIPKADNNVDDHITLHTQVCTEKPNPEEFPVKVLFIVDESGSMCVSDPPGSQGIAQNSICEVYCSQIVPAVGSQALAPGCATNNAKPARVQALEQVLAQFAAENDAIEKAAGTGAGTGPIQVSIVPFETNVFTNVYPSTQFTYGTVDQASLPGALTYVDQLQSELGNATDDQGVLTYAFEQMSTDMAATKQANAGALPKSRYVIVWVTDGTPYPRCTSTQTADGGLPPPDYANFDPFNKPYLTWSDDPIDYCLEAVGKTDCGACCNGGTCTSQNCYCPNPPNAFPGVNGFAFGTDRNQNYQIFDLVNQIMDLKTQYNVGDINLNTILVMNELAVQLCGPPCIDLYGDFPNLSPNQESAAAYSVATWLLSNMARLGNGIFQPFVNGQITQISLAGLNYESFAAQNVMKSLFLQSMTSLPNPSGRIVDSDGDGLTDNLDTNYSQPWTKGSDPLSNFSPDSDGDCFDDNFEVNHRQQGFDPTVPDARCPQTGPGCTDTDGDGLTKCEEDYLGSNTGLVDTDADGVPDAMEVRYGFDPTTYNDFATMDTDGDGISDLDEFMANTDPTTADAELYATDGYRYDIQTTQGKDDTVCYDITISNIRMLQVPSNNGTDGFNLFKLWFSQAPASVLSSDYGLWQVACAWTQYEPPAFRVPAGPILDMTTPDGKNNWFAPPNLRSAADYQTKCVGSPGTALFGL